MLILIFNTVSINQTALETKLIEKFSELNFVYDLLPLSVCIFLVGFIGFMESRDFLTLLVNTELMMLGINFYLITLSLIYGSYEGQIYALCFLAVTAAETAIGLGLLILLYRSKGQITFLELSTLKG
jgi:NADH-quinone oxidoreductase subunit K